MKEDVNIGNDSPAIGLSPAGGGFRGWKISRKRIRLSSYLYIFFLFSVVIACTSNSNQQISKKQGAISLQVPEYQVITAPEWTDLFYRKSGWFGADGIFSIPLDGTDAQTGTAETLLIFSDTYIGEVGSDNKPLPGNTMVNNSIAYVQGWDADPTNIRFHYKQDASGKPQTFFVPQNSTTKAGQYYWLGDGFVNKALNNTLYIFTYHVEMTGDNVFDFIEPDVSLVAIPEGERPPFSTQRQITTPLHIEHDSLGEGNFGCGILVNTDWAGAPNPDGYVYVYACIGQDKSLVVARSKPAHFEDFDQWRYWNGEDWDTDMNNMKAITNAVSNELSMTPLPDGRFLLIFQVLGLSDKVGMRVAASPIGPFGEIHEIYTTPEMAEGIWTYNAKAHPALSKPGELLISYNTITPDFWNDIQEDAHIYRPRFIKLLFK